MEKEEESLHGGGGEISIVVPRKLFLFFFFFLLFSLCFVSCVFQLQSKGTRDSYVMWFIRFREILLGIFPLLHCFLVREKDIVVVDR